MRRGSRGGGDRPTQVNRVAGDVQRDKAAKWRSGEVMDEGLQGGAIQKEGGPQAEVQDPGGSEGDESEQNIVR